MDRALLQTLFGKLAKNTISKEEYEQLMDYLASNKGDESDIPDEVDQNSTLEISAKEMEKAFHRTLQRTRLETSRQVWRLWRQVAAASIAAFIMVGTALFLVPKQQKQRAFKTQDTFLVKKAPLGVRDSLTLSDGSRVWLNAGSSVSYPNDFGTEGPRVVTLQGEAFFDVAALDNQPFIVKTGEIHTTVIGTSFNINTFGPDRLDVTVVQGKVRVDKNQRNLAVLTMNQQVSYQMTSDRVDLSSVDAEEAIAWMDNRVLFRNVRLDRAIEVLSRQFGVTFILSEPTLANCIFSASFEPDESLDTVLQVICLANGIAQTRQGNTIILSGTGCPNQSITVKQK